MIVLNKKKIIYIIVCLLLSVSVYGINSQNKESIEVVSTPVTTKVIVLDAGHGRRRWWGCK